MAKKLISQAELAWPSGDQPGELRFRFRSAPSVEEAIIQVLKPLFEPARAIQPRLHSLLPSDSPIGRYRLSTPNGDWFVRVSSRLGNPDLERMIAAYLSDQGVDVNPLLISGARMVWKGNELRIDVRPFIRGRHYDGSREDLAHLATAMAHCHQSLASFPEPVRVQEIAASRYERHDNVRQLIADCLVNGSFDALFGERAQWAFRHRDWLEEMVDNFHPRFDLIPNAQCLHGQIHPANVLYRVGDGRPILVDWEEAIQVFAPRVYDLAYMVQRFCLHDNPSAEMIQQRLDVVASSYGSLPPLAPMMRQLSWYSMAVILETEVFHGIRVSQTEYEKFVRLERQARTLVGVL